MMGIQGLYKPKKWGGCHHLLLVYDASKPVLGLLQAPENSEFAPPVQFSLNRLKRELKNSQVQNVEWQEKYEKEVAANQKLILDSLKSN